MKAKILIVDDCAELCDKIALSLKGVDGVEVVGVCDNGIKALECISIMKPDIMILDIVMPQLDGFGVLERLTKNDMKIIILSALNQDEYIAQALRKGADYYMVKPFSISRLMTVVKDFVTGAEKAVDSKESSKVISLTMPTREPSTLVNKSMEEKIANIFMTVGIPAHIKGYQFLREAIKIAVDNPDIINSITKKLYPSIADRYDTTSSKVERAIRHAIEVAWNRGKIENINVLFGVKVYNTNEKPTNGEFIALVADKMLIEGA